MTTYPSFHPQISWICFFRWGFFTDSPHGKSPWNQNLGEYVVSKSKIFTHKKQQQNLAIRKNSKDSGSPKNDKSEQHWISWIHMNQSKEHTLETHHSGLPRNPGNGRPVVPPVSEPTSPWIEADQSACKAPCWEAMGSQLLMSNKNPSTYSCWVVVSNIFYVHPYFGKIPILTNIFQTGWNHQLACIWVKMTKHVWVATT